MPQRWSLPQYIELGEFFDLINSFFSKNAIQLHFYCPTVSEIAEPQNKRFMKVPDHADPP